MWLQFFSWIHFLWNFMLVIFLRFKGFFIESLFCGNFLWDNYLLLFWLRLDFLSYIWCVRFMNFLYLFWNIYFLSPCKFDTFALFYWFIFFLLLDILYNLLIICKFTFDVFQFLNRWYCPLNLSLVNFLFNFLHYCRIVIHNIFEAFNHIAFRLTIHISKLNLNFVFF